jgi:hypothetical protein
MCVSVLRRSLFDGGWGDALGLGTHVATSGRDRTLRVRLGGSWYGILSSPFIHFLILR